MNNIYNDVLLLDKPAELTSHDAIDEIRKILKQRRVGHTGTLDPKATGLLVICLGRATKISRFISDLEKVYDAEIHLGVNSKTYDSEGVEPDIEPIVIPNLTKEAIIDTLEKNKGFIKQKVPAYSAVKVNGKKLYQYARKGIEIKSPERLIEIKDIQLLNYNNPFISIRVTCSKGTYIRSLAHDLGQQLGCGGYLSNLKRLAVGSLTLKNALSLEQINSFHNKQILADKLIPFHKILNYGAIEVNDEFKEFVISGKEIKSNDVSNVVGHFVEGDNVFLKDTLGEVLAVGKAEISSTEINSNCNGSKLFSYLRVLN